MKSHFYWAIFFAYTFTACYHAGSPKDKQVADFDLQGHRGARGLMPENTIPAFLKALELGVTTLELDVVFSADSLIVVSHEPWMHPDFCSKPDGSAVTDADTFLLFKMPYDSIKQFDCGLRGNPRFPHQEKIKAIKPLLRDVVEAAERYCIQHKRPLPFYNIETKIEPNWDNYLTPEADTFMLLLHDECRHLGILRRTCIQSFDVRTLQALQGINPLVKTALLVWEKDKPMEFELSQLGYIPDIYSPDKTLVNEALIKKAHEKGMKIIPWTVNSPKEAKQLKAWGVDGLITDYPDSLQSK